MFVLKSVEFFFPLLKLSIMGYYGSVRSSAEEFATKEKDGTLNICYYHQDLHQWWPESTALVVVYCGGTHYVGAGKHSFHPQR